MSYAAVRSRVHVPRAHTGLFPDAADCPTKSSVWVSSASSAAVRPPASRELTSLFPDAAEFFSRWWSGGKFRVVIRPRARVLQPLIPCCPDIARGRFEALLETAHRSGNAAEGPLLLLRHDHVPGLVVVLGSHLEKEDEEEDGGHAEEEGDETAAQDHDDEGAYGHGDEEAHGHYCCRMLRNSDGHGGEIAG